MLHCINPSCWPQEKLHSLKLVLLLWMFESLVDCAGTTVTVLQYVGLMSSPKDFAVVEGLQLERLQLLWFEPCRGGFWYYWHLALMQTVCVCAVRYRTTPL